MTDRPLNELQLEQLEDRLLLDANTSVFIDDGVLKIYSDEGDNFLIVSEVTGGIEVRARSGLGNPHSLNGVVNGTFRTSKSSFDEIDVRLRAGLDSIDFESISLKQDITILGGEGIDVVRFTNFSIIRTSSVPNVTVLGGIGNDDFLARASWFDNLDVRLGEGRNLVRMERTRVLKNTSIAAQGGYDSIDLKWNQYQRFFHVQTGLGGEFTRYENNSFGGSALFEMGHGDDGLFMFRHNEVAGGLSVKLGNGDDTAVIANNTVGNRLLIDGDLNTTFGESTAGRDDIRVSGTQVGTFMNINGRLKDDVIEVIKSEVGTSLKIRSGDGDDKVRIQRSEIGGNAQVLLSAGNDTFLNDHSFHGGSLNVLGGVGQDVLFSIGAEIKLDYSLVGGDQDDQIFTVFADALSNSTISGHDGDDYLFAFANAFLGDVSILGGPGSNGYSAGLADPNEESNFFFGNVTKSGLTPATAVDFRALLNQIRDSF